MLTVNDIHSRCPVSAKPAYLVFEWKQPQFREGFWATTALLPDAEDALAWANATSNQSGETVAAFVCEMTEAEARNIRQNHLTFTDAEVAIYRSPYPALAAE